MSMEYWWNDTDKGKPTCPEENLSQCHSVYLKFHMERPYIETYSLL